jgi:hypothetical protein
MVNEDFEQLMKQVGAAADNSQATPFTLYRKQNILFHFIDFETYAQQQIPDLFLKEMFTRASEAGDKIITVWEDVWHNKQQLVASRILVTCGIRARIHARQTTATRLDKEAACTFLEKGHLQGATSAYYKFGLAIKDEPVAVATFSKSRTMYDGPVYYRSFELERFAVKPGYTVTGGLGKLLRHFINTFHPPHLMTYADADWGNGKGYLKNGFIFVEHTPPQQFLVDVLHMKRAYLHHSQLNTGEIKASRLLLISNSGSLKFVKNMQP